MELTSSRGEKGIPTSFYDALGPTTVGAGGVEEGGDASF